MLRAQDLGQIALRELVERMDLGDGLSAKARVKVDEVVIGALPQWFGTTSSAIRSPMCGDSKSRSLSTSPSKRGDTS